MESGSSVVLRFQAQYSNLFHSKLCKYFGFRILDENVITRSVIDNSQKCGSELGSDCLSWTGGRSCSKDCNGEKSVCQNPGVCKGQVKKMRLVSRSGSFGVESNTFIPKGEFICETLGEVYDIKEVKSTWDDNRRGFFFPRYSLVLDCSKMGNIGRYIRPSHQCNSTLEPLVVNKEIRFAFYATKPIPPGHEITMAVADGSPKEICECGHLESCPDASRVFPRSNRFEIQQCFPTSQDSQTFERHVSSEEPPVLLPYDHITHTNDTFEEDDMPSLTASEFVCQDIKPKCTKRKRSKVFEDDTFEECETERTPSFQPCPESVTADEKREQIEELVRLAKTIARSAVEKTKLGNGPKLKQGRQNNLPWKCSHCNGSFTHIGNYRRHLESYFKTQDFPCKYAGCVRVFDNDSARKEHHLYHSKKENGLRYRCDKCNRDYAKRTDCTRHQKKKHDGTGKIVAYINPRKAKALGKYCRR